MRLIQLGTLHRFTLLALSAGLLVACGKSQDSSSDAPLAFVPADTPYVYANLEPTPAAVIEQWSRYDPAPDRRESHADRDYAAHVATAIIAPVSAWDRHNPSGSGRRAAHLVPACRRDRPRSSSYMKGLAIPAQRRW